MNVYLICKDGGSDKFWSITNCGVSYYVRYGKNGTFGHFEVKTFETEAACAKAAETLISSKRKKGYSDGNKPFVDLSSETAQKLQAYKKEKDYLSEEMREMFLSEGEGECGVYEGHIAAADCILEEFTDAVCRGLGSEKTIMLAVKNAVSAFNRLNESTDYSLIETEERELIWDYMDSAVQLAGIDTEGKDITEDWREW
ncbi:MAG: WGR domain-containing protein [Clostridiales bacterium]|jgi:predicted DNA-binding WGR domain protein|nr:WGR domain-containing protein [Clostridiales bacterium]